MVRVSCQQGFVITIIIIIITKSMLRSRTIENKYSITLSRVSEAVDSLKHVAGHHGEVPHVITGHIVC